MLYRIICHKHIFAPGIPEFLQCHASTLTLLPGDGIAAAWFAGDHEKAPNVGIWFSRCTADRNWTYPVKIADGDGIDISISQEINEELECFYKYISNE